MPTDTQEILIVEDSPTLLLTYEAYLAGEDYPVSKAANGAEALDHIFTHKPAVILLDLKLPDMDGLDILRELNARGIDAQVIMITAHGSVTTAVDAMREGATDFLLKPFSKERLVITVRNAIKIYKLTHLVETFQDSQKPKNFAHFIGKSPPMQAVYRMIEDAAPSKASVFIIGESGTGKELAAEAIHNYSPRKTNPFIALNCAAIPANLIESEVFGHKKGAFTGATADRDGASVQADGGTLFLDEICEMPLDLQSKLLRFIQSGQVMPVGASKAQQVDVRFICATNRDPWEEVRAGRFREDLYYRLHVIPVHLPPLKERGQDIIQIALSMLFKHAKEEGKSFKDISADGRARLMAHSWPGNVRELGNVILSTIVLNEGEALTANMLAPLMGSRHNVELQASENSPRPSIEMPISAGASTDVVTDNDIEPLALTERKAIEYALTITGGKVRPAARKLQVNPSTLYRKLKAWGYDEMEFS